MLNKLRGLIYLLILVFISSSCMYLNRDNFEKTENIAEYTLIVIGGEPEGIAAALSAARLGIPTLLIEDSDTLGGLMTQGRLNFLDMNSGPDKELLTQGIFADFFKEVGNAFDIKKAEKYFLDLVEKEPNLILKLNTKFQRPILEENRLVGVVVQENGLEKSYYAPRIIDATTDADVAALAGVPYTVGAEDYGLPDKNMGVTLVFRIKGVNWPYVYLYNNLNRLINKINSKWGDPHGGATWKVAWGYGKQALEYEPQDKMMRFRGPNLARQKDGSVLVNALLIFDVDGLSPESKEQGIERGKKELPSVIEFMKRKFPGFRNVELVDVAEELYVRETRHIVGEYRLTIDDVLENRDQWDRIAHGSYPVDLQPSGPEDLGNIIGKPAIYSIPFRSLVPLKVDNLLVVGRSASYDSLAHGSARVLPVGMAVGEAAGVASLYSIENKVTYRQMTTSSDAVSWVQDKLKEQGAYLVEYTPPKLEVMDHWAYPGLKVMRSLGLAAGGYKNDYSLDKTIQYWDAQYFINETLARIQYFQGEQKGYPVTFTENISRGDLLVGAAEALSGKKLLPPLARQYLQENKVLSQELQTRYTQLDQQPTFAELYTLCANMYEFLMKEGGFRVQNENR